MKSNLHDIFGVYSCGCSKMIKIKNKQVNKQMNKQTKKKRFLDPEYLSQITSDPRKIFMVYSCGCPKMFKIKKTGQQTKNKQTNK